VWEDPITQVRISPPAVTVVFITTATAIYSLGHGLHTLTAVPRLTQPSTFRGTVNEYQLSGWVIIKWRWRMWTVAAILSCRLAVQVGWLGRGLAATSALSLHSSNEPGELSQWLCHDDSTTNITLVMIIIIIIIITTCFCARKCLLGPRLHCCFIWGAWIGIFKLNAQNVKTCIGLLSKLLRRL